MPSEAERKREMFFSWFRQRAENLSALDSQVEMPIHFVPEQHVLAAAALDALARFWAETFSDPRMKHARRMGEFLSACGGSPVFLKCSRADLLYRARNKPRILAVLRQVLDDDPSDAQPLNASHDPTLSELAEDARLRTVGIERRWLSNSRFGEVLYREIRCSWVHEFQASRRAGYGGFHPERDEPWYDNRSHLMRGRITHYERRLVFPRAFLLATLQRSINEFEAACERAGLAPRTMDRD